MKVVIVSRHEATVNLLKRMFPEARVIDHLNSVDEIEDGSLVIGNLPIDMIEELLKKGCRFVLISLKIPREMRGKELNEEELKKFIKLVEVKKLELEEFKLS